MSLLFCSLHGVHILFALLSKPKLYSVSMEQQYVQERYNIFNSREVSPPVWKSLRHNSPMSIYAGYVSRCETQKLPSVKKYWELIKHLLLFSVAWEEYVQPIIVYSAHCLWFSHEQLLSFLNLTVLPVSDLLANKLSATSIFYIVITCSFKAEIIYFFRLIRQRKYVLS